ncbi:hypothetical protein ACLOJK_034104 [Asimina triloba]
MTRGKQKIEAQRRNAERNQKPKGSQLEARAVALKVSCPICKVSFSLSFLIIILVPLPLTIIIPSSFFFYYGFHLHFSIHDQQQEEQRWMEVSDWDISVLPTVGGKSCSSEHMAGSSLQTYFLR